MQTFVFHGKGNRLASDAGIAIGPILFIIAVLGILASAIAAGSGSFTTSTTNESYRAKATALIDMGQNLKVGFDRIVGTGTDFSSVNIDPDDTTADSDLFSPTGGGISAPSITMAATPGTDIWYYPLVRIPKIGTASGSRLAVIRITEGVCDEINSKANALDAGTADDEGADLGDFTGSALLTPAAWPLSLQGKPVGCVENTLGGTEPLSVGFFFYQVIGIS